MSHTPRIERAAALAAERQELLKSLANEANFAHEWAKSSAGAAVSHALAAGNALARARDLCGGGEWGRWVRKNFGASLRTAQRYMRLANDMPKLTGDATRVSQTSQAKATRAIRHALFAIERKRRSATPPISTMAVPAGSAASLIDPLSAPHAVPAQRVPALAVAGLERLAASLREASSPGDAAATYIIRRIEALSADIRLDGHEEATDNPPQLVYFAEALGADRVKIGVAEDPVARLASMQTACPHPLRLLAKVPGGRLLEASLHARLAPFHLGGEWFHLAKPVRALIDTMTRSVEGADGAASP